MVSNSNGPPQLKRAYRVFVLNEDGHVTRAEVIDADNDADAAEQAQSFANDSPIELWDRGRKVARFDKPGDKVAAKRPPSRSENGLEPEA